MRLTGMIERSGMELHKLHILHRTLGTIDHSLTVAGGDHGVSGCLVDGTTPAGAHHRDTAQVGVNFVLRVEHIGTVAIYIRRAAGDTRAEMVLRDNLHSEVVLLDLYVRVRSHGSHQRTLYLSAGIVGMVEDTKLRVTALAVEVIVAIVLFVEVGAPLHQSLDLLGCFGDDLLDSIDIVDIVTGDNGVVDMLVEIVKLQISDRGHTALGETSVGLVKSGLADDAYFTFLSFCHFQGIAHAGNTGTDNQKVIFISHDA